MYIHTKVLIHDKQILEQAIKYVFRQPLSGLVKLVIDRYGNEDFLLTETQLQQLQQEGIVIIVCDQDQILNYAHSCINAETLKKILD